MKLPEEIAGQLFWNNSENSEIQKACDDEDRLDHQDANIVLWRESSLSQFKLETAL